MEEKEGRWEISGRTVASATGIAPEHAENKSIRESLHHPPTQGNVSFQLMSGGREKIEQRRPGEGERGWKTKANFLSPSWLGEEGPMKSVPHHLTPDPGNVTFVSSLPCSATESPAPFGTFLLSRG